MEEQVKARLIGATVLVVVAVALVPELLSGPRSPAPSTNAAQDKRGTRTVTIDLGGAVAAGSRAQQAPAAAESKPREPAPLPVVPAPGAAAEQGRDLEAASEPAGVSEPSPGVRGEPSPGPRPEPSPGLRPTSPATAGEVKTASASSPGLRPTSPATAGEVKTASAGSGWSVQVGAFGSAEAARKLVGDLKQAGLSAYVAPLQRNGKTLHRVRVGPTPTRPDADKLAAKLKAKGLPASVVASD